MSIKLELTKIFNISALIGVLILLSSTAFAQKGQAPEDDADQSKLSAKQEMDLYYEGMRLAREGSPEEAKQKLRIVAEIDPPGNFQDDAYYEIARITDQIQTRYREALALYEEMVAKFPNARPSRRAKRRLEFLRKALVSGEEPLRSYENILKKYKAEELEALTAEMQQMLDEQPNFALRWDAMLWLANAKRRLNKYAEAVEIYEQLERENKGTDREREAMLGEAECLVGIGNISKARAMFENLAKTEGFGKHAADSFLANLDKGLTHKIFKWISIGILLLALLVLPILAFAGKLHRPESWMPSIEFWAILPIMVIVTFFGSQHGDFMVRFSLTITTLTLLLLYVFPILVNGMVLKRWWQKAIFFLCATLLVLACIFMAVESGDLYDQVLYDMNEYLR